MASHYENMLKLADFASVFAATSATTVVSGGNVMPTEAGSNPFHTTPVTPVGPSLETPS